MLIYRQFLLRYLAAAATALTAAAVKSATLAVFSIFLVLGCKPGAGKVAYVGGSLWDGSGSAPVTNAVILVDSDTIEAIGSAETLKVPRGADVRRIDGGIVNRVGAKLGRGLSRSYPPSGAHERHVRLAPGRNLRNAVRADTR